MSAQHSADPELEAEIARLGDLSLARLREEWKRVCRTHPPRVSRALLRRGIGYELQVRRLGGLTPFARRALRDLAAGRGCVAPAMPGTRFVREWQGAVHVVTVNDDGRFFWNDQPWRSLSAIARGDHRNALVGPSLFRCEQAFMKRVRCAIYTRKSSDEGLEQDFNSLHAQREACEAYVASQAGEGWTASSDRYDDGGLSGGTLARPALQTLLADIEGGRVDVVVVYKVDRLTRSLLDFAKLVEAFDTAQISFVSVTQAFNTTNSMGRLTLNMLLSFAQFEREVTAERIRDKISASKRKGMWMGGVPPIGYKPDGRSLKIVERHAAVVRHVFALYLELGSVRAVAERLADESVRTPVRKMVQSGRQFGGGPFSRGQIYRMLSNPIYIGEITCGEERWPGLHKPIIDHATWDKAQTRRTNNAHDHRTKTNARDPSLLAALLFDAGGEPLVGTHATKSGRRYRYYTSRSLQHGVKTAGNGTRMPAREIERLVCGRLAEVLEDPLKLAADIGVSIDAAELNNANSIGPERAKQLRSPVNRNSIALIQALVERVEIEPASVNCNYGVGRSLRQ